MDLGSSEASSEVFWGDKFSSACGCEFCDVVGSADHGPFGFDLVDAAQEELAEASCLLDLAEDRLDDLFSQSICFLFVVAALVPCFCRPVAT